MNSLEPTLMLGYLLCKVSSQCKLQTCSDFFFYKARHVYQKKLDILVGSNLAVFEIFAAPDCSLPSHQ